MVPLYFGLGGTNHDSDQGHHKSNQIAQLQGVSDTINHLGDIPYIVERISDQRERVGVKSGFAFTLGRLVLKIIMIKHTNEFGHEKGERNGYRRGQSLFAIHSDRHLASGATGTECILQYQERRWILSTGQTRCWSQLRLYEGEEKERRRLPIDRDIPLGYQIAGQRRRLGIPMDVPEAGLY